MSLTSTCKILSWDEDRANTATPRVVPATVGISLPGPDVKATGTEHFIMTYTSNGDAVYHFTAEFDVEDLGGKSGKFIAQGTGSYVASPMNVEGTFESVDGTGQGGLEGVKIKGGYGMDPKSESGHDVLYHFEIVEK